MVSTVDFAHVLKTLLAELERQGIRYAAIGGFALGALGVVRATADVDLLVHRDDLERFHQLLSRLGYVRRVQTENVSHYQHADEIWGTLDILHAFRTYALGMLERARTHPVFGGTQSIRVLEPEDVIGLKIQAMANDPQRRTHEQADIEALMTAYRNQLDWTRLQEYYDLFELSEEGRNLRERFGHAE